MSKDSKQIFRTGILITLTRAQIALGEQYKENQGRKQKNQPLKYFSLKRIIENNSSTTSK